MKITRKSIASGIERTLDLNITDQQWNSYQNGTSIQVAMPGLSADDREFILSGMTPEEWDEAMKDED